jgi:four helix bundle protein
MRNDKEKEIVKLTFEFSLVIIEYCEILEQLKKFVIARQLLKSGTGIGANVREAQNAESKADFIHKLKIAAKVADETSYWLELCKFSDNYPDCEDLLVKL